MRRTDLSMGQDDDANEINLTPMLDVVFIMLIFFIVTASFIKEAGIDVNRPDAPVTETKPENANILVVINANDEIWIDRRTLTLGLCAPILSVCTRKTQRERW